jgi:hypothetical protein
MKTFEQLLQEIEPYPFRQHGKPLYTFEQFQEANRKWLEQKFDAVKGRMEYYHSNEPEQMQTLGKVKVLKEILGELSVPAKESRSGTK